MLSEETIDKLTEMMLTYPPLQEQFINILLVASGGRDVMLVETANFKRVLKEEFDVDDGIDILENFMTILEGQGYKFDIKETDISVPDYPRYFITSRPLKRLPENDYEIGRLLDMYCADHLDYHDYNQDRTSLHIFALFNNERKDLFAEVCITRKLNKEGLIKSAFEKTKKWEKSLRSLGFDIPILQEIEDTYSYPTLEKKIEEGDIQFLKDNYQDYFNYFANEIQLDTEEDVLPFLNYIEERGINNKTMNYFKYLMKKVKNCRECEKFKGLKLNELVEKYEEMTSTGPLSSTSSRRKRNNDRMTD